MNEQVVGELKSVIREHRGNVPLNLCIEFVEGQKVFLNTDGSYKVRPSKEFEQQIEQTIGEGLVYIAGKSDALKNPPKPRKWEKKKAG